MHEEMEYAEMLEIPVTTVNVVKKKGRKPKKTAGLKEKVISKVNDGAPESTGAESTAQTSTSEPTASAATAETAPAAQPTAEATPPSTVVETTAEPTATSAQPTAPAKKTGKKKRSVTQKQSVETPSQTEPTETVTESGETTSEAEAETASTSYVAESVPVHIPRRKKVPFFARLFGKKAGEWEMGDGAPAPSAQPTEAAETTESATPETVVNTDETNNERSHTPAKKEKYALVFQLEFAAACALCLGIFLTNVFMPNSAINTFFRFLASSPQEADARTYADFTLSSIIYEEGTEFTVSETGVLSFTDAGCIYPAVDGTVTDVLQESDGTWTVKISHSPSFSEIISGLSYAPLQAGDKVKSNIPVGYSDGTSEVQVTMYDSGELLNCFHVTENGGLAWSVEE